MSSTGQSSKSKQEREKSRKLVNVLDKEEFRIKLEEINHLVEVKDYKGAMEVVDSIDWRRVKNVRTLCVVGEIYAANKKYDDSKEIFRLAYHRSPIGKNILYRLVEICLKTGDIEDAEDYYDEFCIVAPHDSNSHILKYKILKAEKAPVEEQIKALEAYKEKEFTEKWSYELASLYYQSGQKEKCQELCNEMILWFSEGNYILKALDLKSRMGTLTEKEKQKYEEQLLPVLKKKEEDKGEESEEEKEENEEEVSSEEGSEEKPAEKPEKSDGSEESEESAADKEDEEPEQSDEEPEYDEDRETPHIDSILIKNERDLQDAETLQERISKGIRDLFGGIRKEIGPSDEEDEFKIEEEEKEEDEEENVLEKEPEINYDDVPPLEKEGEAVAASRKRRGFSRPFHIPDLKASQKADKPEKSEILEKLIKKQDKHEKPGKQNAFLPDEEELEDIVIENIVVPEEPPKEFNLEDTILAAATAQGIDIPEEESEEETEEEVLDISVEAESADAEEEEDVSAIIKEETASGDEEENENVPDLEFPDLKPEEIDLDEVEDKSILPKPIEEKDLFNEENYKENEILKEEKKEEEKPEAAADEDQDLTEEERLEKFIASIHPEPEKNADIIPREKDLREEEMKLFSYFVKVPGMKDQIIDTLSDVQLGAADHTSRSGNVIVMGGVETGKTRLISGLIPAICKELNLEASKVAYVFADQLNGKNIDRIVEKLSGGFLVIEKANQLDQKTAEALNQAMERDTNGMIFILEDDKIGMRKMIARYPKLAKKFTSIINIPVFTNDELAYFAKVYAMENGYKIDDMAMLALYNLIGINQKEDMPMNIGAVKNIIDSAIAKTQGGLKVFRKKVSKKRMDKDGYITLLEKDFNV